MRTNKVQGIMELDEDMQFLLPAAGDKDVDLSMLTAVLRLQSRYVCVYVCS